MAREDGEGLDRVLVLEDESVREGTCIHGITNDRSQAILRVHIPNPGVSAEVVGYQDEMAQRYVKNALARARARKERDTSEAEEGGG